MSGELPDLAERLNAAIEPAQDAVNYFGDQSVAAEMKQINARDVLATLKDIRDS